MIGSFKLQVGPLRLSRCSEQELLNEVSEYTIAKRECIITYAHLHTLALATKDGAVAKTINCCDICYCDGIGVSYMSILTNGQWLPKVTANNFVDKLTDIALVNRLKIAIIGGRPETISTAKEYFNQRGALIVYSRDGYFNEIHGDIIRQELVYIEPDLILIGIGQDRQEKFAFSLKHLLPRTVLFCLGGLFFVHCRRRVAVPKMDAENWFRMDHSTSQLSSPTLASLFTGEPPLAYASDGLAEVVEVAIVRPLNRL